MHDGGHDNKRLQPHAKRRASIKLEGGGSTCHKRKLKASTKGASNAIDLTADSDDEQPMTITIGNCPLQA